MFLETELLIREPSQDFIREAVRSIPGRVTKGELVFSALGLTLPNEQGEFAPYYEECRRLGIIPYTQLHYEYNQGSFRTRLFETAGFPTLMASKEVSVEELVFKGGKINLISFKLHDSFGGSGFRQLNETLLAKLLVAGYSFSMGDFTLAREYHPNAQLLFSKGSMRLNGYETRSEEEEDYHEELQGWFHDLAQKYHNQILIPVYS